MKKKIFTLLTLLLAVCSGAWATGTAISVTWLPYSMAAISQAGTASVNDILTVSDLSYSSDISSLVIRTYDSKNWGDFIPENLTGTNGNYSKDDYITFSVTVKSGYTFIPTSVSAYAIGRGTGKVHSRTDPIVHFLK